MLFLLLSILFNTAIYLMFKWFDKLGVQIFPAIVINYVVAFFVGILLVPDFDLAMTGFTQLPNWAVAGIILGLVFVFVFYLIAASSQNVGVSATIIASKMSLVLAVLLFVLTDENEKLTAVKIIAIVFAVVGVVFTSIRSGGKAFEMQSLFGLLLILLGATVIDFSIAHFSEGPVNDSELSFFTCISFGAAAIFGMVVLISKLVIGKLRITARDISCGVLLGIVNYGSIFFLIQAYHSNIFQKSILLPLNNLFIVLLGALSAMLLFKEKLSKFNWLGIAFGLISLTLLLYQF